MGARDVGQSKNWGKGGWGVIVEFLPWRSAVIQGVGVQSHSFRSASLGWKRLRWGGVRLVECWGSRIFEGEVGWGRADFNPGSGFLIRCLMGCMGDD
eukprot:767672-Hanusia_phi.AAC.2